MDADVIVVGAGPAGAAAAKYTAAAGLSVLLLDRAEFPRDKICGDFVGPRALIELARLGVSNRPSFKRTNLIRQAAVYVNGKEILSKGVPAAPGAPGFARVIPRETLDNWLADEARASGAVILEDHRLTGFELREDAIELKVLARGRPTRFRAGLVIGADGSRSTVARFLVSETSTRRKDQVLAVRAYFADVQQVHDRAELYFSSESFPGYCWMFPTGGDTANVGLGMLDQTLPPKSERLRDTLERLIQRDPILRQRLGSARLIGKIVGWPLSTYNPRYPVIGPRMMLVGDAAGLINPLNGEGIYQALASGGWAADAAIQCARKGDFSSSALLPYAQKVKDELMSDMLVARALMELIRNRNFAPFWLAGLQVIGKRSMRDPLYGYLFGGILAGVVSARRALTAGMMADTIHEALWSTGLKGLIKAVKNPTRTLRVGLKGSMTLRDIVRQSTANPASTFHWSLDVMRSLVELSGDVLRIGPA
ncbi:MAG: geranylgeranyl reductase family protein [Planctomycetota bacterium]|nr:geranylgeranyl reductase family protein [Planctomycetota bacterium]